MSTTALLDRPTTAAPVRHLRAVNHPVAVEAPTAPAPEPAQPAGRALPAGTAGRDGISPGTATPSV